MKSQLLIVVLLGLSLGTAGAWDGAPDISGTWVFSVDTDKSKLPVNLTFVFKQEADAGYADTNALVMKLEPMGSDEKTPQLAARYRDLLRQVEAIPSVQVASLVGYSPIRLREWLVLGVGPEGGARMYVQGYTPQPGEEMLIPTMEVYPNSFAALGIPLLAGRDFSPQDIQNWMAGIHCWGLDGRLPAGTPPGPTRVGIINESMARRFYGNESPIGRLFGFQIGDNECLERKDVRHNLWIEIIGVVKDVKYTSLRNEGRAMFYLPFSQTSGGRGRMTLVVRTAGDPTSVAAAVQAEARALDPRMPMFEAETLATQGEVFTGSLSRGVGERVTGTLKGNKVVFSVEGKSGGLAPFKHTYTGTIESPTRMSGTIEFGEGSSGKWTATKK